MSKMLEDKQKDLKSKQVKSTLEQSLGKKLINTLISTEKDKKSAFDSILNRRPSKIADTAA